METHLSVKICVFIICLAFYCQNSQITGRVLVDEYCEKWNSAECKCDKCYQGYWYDKKAKQCKLPNLNCKTFCYSTGKCTSCFECSDLVDGQCLQYPCGNPPCEETEDQNCQDWDIGDQNCICQNCRDGYWYDAEQNLCKLPNPSCAQFSYENGECTACPNCYALVQGQCYPTPGAPEYCIECGDRQWYNPQIIGCQDVSEDCEQFNEFNGYCTLCKDITFIVNQDGQCVSNQAQRQQAQQEEIYCQITDNNCHEWNYDSCECAVCSGGYWFNSKTTKCEKVSDKCKEFNAENGHCTDCWEESEQVDENGQCIKNVAPSSSIECNWSNPNCNQFDADGCCTKCSYRYFFNVKGECQEVSQYCREFDEDTGDCTSCYFGYEQINGQCIAS